MFSLGLLSDAIQTTEKEDEKKEQNQEEKETEGAESQLGMNVG